MPWALAQDFMPCIRSQRSSTAQNAPNAQHSSGDPARPPQQQSVRALLFVFLSYRLQIFERIGVGFGSQLEGVVVVWLKIYKGLCAKK